MKQVLEQLVNTAIKQAFGEEFVGAKGVVLSYPPTLEMGDYASNAGLVLAKQLKMSPKEVAEKIVAEISKQKSDIGKVEIAGGFINFTLSQKYLFGELEEIIKRGDKYGASDQNLDKKVVIDYFQNNIAKPPHVGHLRSAVIGDAIKRLFLFLGYDAVSDTHVGDWGVQFGIVLYAFKTMGDKMVVEKDPIQELNKLYVAMSNKISEQPELRDLCKEEFVKLEKGDEENRQLWEWFVKVSMEDFERYRVLMNLLPFDYNLGESFYEDKMQAILEELQAKDLVQKGEGGELYVDLDGDGLGRCILIKTDGGTTYHLRDFATYKYRKDVVGFWKNLYVVDVRQSHHFKQLFKVLEKAGYPAESDSVHVDFGFMALPEGAISTRKGNVISLESLVGEGIARAKAIIEEKNPSLANKDDVAQKVALAAIKYFDLAHNRQSNITFTWDKALSFEGNTGPYLQYTHARIHGIARKMKLEPREEELPAEFIINQYELNLLRKLILFKDVLIQSAGEYLPNLICNYLFELSQIFNRFYEEVPVINSSGFEYITRVKLCNATRQVIKNGLVLLGIEAPEEM